MEPSDYSLLSYNYAQKHFRLADVPVVQLKFRYSRRFSGEPAPARCFVKMEKTNLNMPATYTCIRPRTYEKVNYTMRTYLVVFETGGHLKFHYTANNYIDIDVNRLDPSHQFFNNILSQILHHLVYRRQQDSIEWRNLALFNLPLNTLTIGNVGEFDGCISQQRNLNNRTSVIEIISTDSESENYDPLLGHLNSESIISVPSHVRSEIRLPSDSTFSIRAIDPIPATAVRNDPIEPRIIDFLPVAAVQPVAAPSSTAINVNDRQSPAVTSDDSTSLVFHTDGCFTYKNRKYPFKLGMEIAFILKICKALDYFNFDWLYSEWQSNDSFCCFCITLKTLPEVNEIFFYKLSSFRLVKSIDNLNIMLLLSETDLRFNCETSQNDLFVLPISLFTSHQIINMCNADWPQYECRCCTQMIYEPCRQTCQNFRCAAYEICARCMGDRCPMCREPIINLVSGQGSVI